MTSKTSEARQEKKKKRKRRRIMLLVAIAALIVALVGGLGTFIWYKQGLKAVGTNGDETIAVEIKEGESLDALLEDLKAKDLIRSVSAAKLYTAFHDTPRYAGIFDLNQGMNVETLFKTISDPANAQLSYAIVTIPEGEWAKDIAQIIADAIPNITKEDLLMLWNDSEYIDSLAGLYSFIDPSVLNNDQFFVKLEGYLFPDTYYIDFDLNADQITRMLLDQFGVVYEKYRPQIEASPYSLEQILTLASMIQFESGSVSEMADIAGVFYNRLNANMPLQSSVTVCYALYDQFSSPEQCETHYDIASPYNTYQNAGLPIGPILNPGEAAIAAALSPAQNDYLFFVGDIYGDGTTHFATTYEEHLANIEKYNLNLSSQSQ